MTETTTHQREQLLNGAGAANGHAPPPAEPEPEPEIGAETATVQSGAALFPHVVWAHFQWERKLHKKKSVADADLEHAYRETLRTFQEEQGTLEQVYWCTRTASAVGMTVKEGRTPRWNFLHLSERDDRVRFHRVTDWVTRDAPHVAELLNECDLLASRVEQVLRGASQRIAIRSIVGIASHLLGFIERESPKQGQRRDDERQFVRTQRARLVEVETYYHRAASQAGRVVYVSGMLIGLGLIALLGAAADLLLSLTSMSSYHRGLMLLCYGSGAIGALVSTISRMGSPSSGKFNVDFELGRRLVRRLGLFRPFVGGIFGVAIGFVLASGLLALRPDAGLEPYYYGIAAFLAGFSERFAKVMFGETEKRLIAVDDDGGAPDAATPRTDAVEEM